MVGSERDSDGIYITVEGSSVDVPVSCCVSTTKYRYWSVLRVLLGQSLIV